MAQITFTVPDADLDGVLAAFEVKWKAEGQAVATRAGQVYDSLPSRQKLRVCIIGSVRAYTRNQRREAAERAAHASVREPDIT